MDVIPNEPVIDINVYKKKILMEAAYYTMMKEQTLNINIVEIENYLNKISGIYITTDEVYRFLSSFFIKLECAQEYISTEPLMSTKSDRDLPNEEVNNEALLSEEDQDNNIKETNVYTPSQNITSDPQINSLIDKNFKEDRIKEIQINESDIPYKSRLRPRNKKITNQRVNLNNKDSSINSDKKENNPDNPSPLPEDENLPKMEITGKESNKKNKEFKKEDCRTDQSGEKLQHIEIKKENYTCMEQITKVPEQTLNLTTNKKKNKPSQAESRRFQVGNRNLKRRLQEDSLKQVVIPVSEVKRNRSKRIIINEQETNQEKPYQTRSVTANQGRKLRSRIIKSSHP